MTNFFKTLYRAAGKLNVLIIFILAAELSVIFFLLSQRRLVSHDSLDHFTFQYYFLNNAVFSGEIPQWMPYLAHGVPTAWWYGISGSGGFLHNILLHTGPLLKNVNFMVIYYFGIFIDHFFLLAGVWLLGQRFYSSYFTRAFVTLTIVGSTIWFSNIYYNFHFYYTIPLILYFAHQFLDTRDWKNFFLAANLFLLQIITNLPYFTPVVSLIIFLYFLFFIIINKPTIQIKSLKPPNKLSFFIYLILTGLSGAAVCFILKSGITPEQIINFQGRTDQGGVSLDAYLKSGDFAYQRIWLDLCLGISPAVDFTVYIGLIPLALLILLRPDKKSWPIILLIITILLFSSGTFIAQIFYHWPFMSYFRHLTPTLAIAKLFLCLLTGFGVDRLTSLWSKEGHKIKLGPTFIILGCILFLGYLCLNNIALDKKQAQSLPILIILPPNPQYLLSEKEIFSFFQRTAYVMLLLSLIFFSFKILQGRNKKYLVVSLFLFQLLDLYTHKFDQIKVRTGKLNELQYKITRFDPLPYAEKRLPFALTKNTREWLFNFQSFSKKKATYHTIHGFLFFKDQLDMSPDSYNWLKPLHTYLRAYWDNDHKNMPKQTEVFENRITSFPIQNSAANKISGFTEERIQFFSKAYSVPSEKDLARLITDPKYPGDLLFILPATAKNFNAPAVDPWQADMALSTNHRIKNPYHVTQFNSNHIEISADVPLDEKTAWLFFSDTWHSGWKAKVNGRPVPVFQANMAYKAVPLQPGHNIILFSFHSAFLAMMYGFLALNSLFWLGLIFRLMGKTLIERL